MVGWFHNNRAQWRSSSWTVECENVWNSSCTAYTRLQDPVHFGFFFWGGLNFWTLKTPICSDSSTMYLRRGLVCPPQLPLSSPKLSISLQAKDSISITYEACCRTPVGILVLTNRFGTSFPTIIFRSLSAENPLSALSNTGVAVVENAVFSLLALGPKYFFYTSWTRITFLSYGLSLSLESVSSGIT